MAGELEAAGPAIDPEDGDVVAALIAAIEEPAGRIEIETARVVPAGPFLPDERERSRLAHGKPRDAVVQTVGGIDKSAIGGDHDFGAEIAASKAGCQRGDGLPLGEAGPVAESKSKS